MADQKDKIKVLDDKFKKVVAAVAQTEAGKELFREIMKGCHFHKSVIAANPQTHEININTTLYNEARRRFYLDLRQFIPVPIRRQIES